MQDIFAKCGINCGRCPSYKDNLITDADRQRCSDGWYTYHGFRLTPDKLRRCDGCQAPDDESPVRYLNCNTRKCALFNHVETCAHCSAYPCDTPGIDVNREEVEARLGAPVPEEDYLLFIAPYESGKHLETIRASLKPEEIVDMKPVVFKPKTVDFPPDLNVAQEERSAFEAIHRLLSTLEAAEGISYARQAILKKNRQQLLKVLWAFGCFGKPDETGSYLRLESETYLAQKIHSNLSTVKSYFEALESYGVHCEYVPSAKEDWLTPTGALRKGNWFMTLSFREDAGGVSALKAFQRYTAALHKHHAQKAFRYFSRADMRVLQDT